MKKIYSVALNLHDHNTYDGVFHNQRERYTRFKHNLPYHAEAYNHQSDILNPGDYRLNKQFVREYWDTNWTLFVNTLKSVPKVISRQDSTYGLVIHFKPGSVFTDLVQNSKNRANFTHSLKKSLKNIIKKSTN